MRMGHFQREDDSREYVIPARDDLSLALIKCLCHKLIMISKFCFLDLLVLEASAPYLTENLEFLLSSGISSCLLVMMGCEACDLTLCV